MEPDSSQTHGVPGLVALSVVMTVLPTIAIALRIWSRLISKGQRFWWDDWFAIGSLPFSIAQMGLTLKMISEGLGRHQGELALEQVIEVARYAYANTIFYDIVISIPKYSAVFFYIRLFPIDSKVFRISVWVTNALITAHLFASILLLAFQCYPLKKGWQPATTGHCINNFNWFLAILSMSVIIDIVIMLIPLPIVWNLKTGRSRKLMLTGIFFCAYCVIVISLARLIVYAQIARTFRADFTWNTIPYYRWIGCEGPVSIVSICAPNIFYLCKRARCHGLSSLFTRREYHAKIQDRLNKNLKSPPTLDEELLGIDKDGTLSSRTDGVYSVEASAEDRFEEGSMIAMVDRTHVRRDYDVIEEERWSQCAAGMGNAHL